MPTPVPFTDNYTDHSTEAGFQFEFFCERCGRITDHISISHAGSLARVNRREPLPMRLVSRVVGKLNDLNPVQNLLLGRPYRCGRLPAAPVRLADRCGARCRASIGR